MKKQTHAMEKEIATLKKVNTSMWNVEDAERFAENTRVIDEYYLRRA